jgi:hypothetical protein
MNAISLALGLFVLSQNSKIEAKHAENPVYKSLLAEEVTLNGTRVSIVAPAISDDATKEEQRAALRGIAGSDQKLDELLRDSVSAPFILRVHDAKAHDGDIIRSADVWFTVHADLDEVDFDDLSQRASNAKPVEAGNMRFASKLLSEADLKPFDLATEQSAPKDRREWYVHLTGRLLDRIQVEATNRVSATRSKDSLVVASLTAKAFTEGSLYPNLWRPIPKQGSREKSVTSHLYAGGVGYAKISRIAIQPRTLLVETHLVFLEPNAWFEGAPILRSKISVIAQDQIRRLRREIAERRTRPARDN